MGIFGKRRKDYKITLNSYQRSCVDTIYSFADVFRLAVETKREPHGDLEVTVIKANPIEINTIEKMIESRHVDKRNIPKFER